MNTLIILGVVGPWQVVLIVAALLLFVGGKKIPQLMKGIGEGMREFKNAKDGDKEDKNQELKN
jgi:sec-independent protein translocase protein TatA